MNTRIKKSLAVILILALVAVPCSALASNVLTDEDQVKAGEMVADLVVVRPLGIATVVLGFAVFLVSTPFSALGGNTGQAWETMVVKPTKFTFKRPLGDFNN